MKFDPELIRRLNTLSLTRTFTPQIDIDWDANTTDEEYESLYSSWSLLVGTGRDRDLSKEGRVRFVRYQQMNLMLFTQLLERHAITALSRTYDLDPAEAFSEYIGHFLKEEIYHTMMFERAIRKIQAASPQSRPLPRLGLDLSLRLLFALTNAIPFQKLRTTLTFTILRFAEQVSIYACQTTQELIPRRESFISQVWSFHAMDESRHLAFDAMILEKNRLQPPFTRLPILFAVPCCILLSVLLNANEIWIARMLGLRIGLVDLPSLMRSTTAPFKRRVFGLLVRTLRGDESASACQ
ncbi:MAG: diiron oxygenase [Chloroflexi bacterium]|nr:diiron oxygenase [Chloroflexota bacterium]